LDQFLGASGCSLIYFSRWPVSQRARLLQRPLYAKAEDRARVLQRQLDVYNEAEGKLENQVNEGLETQANLEEFRYNKVTLEIELLIAKGNLSQTQPAP
jgi:hypothetical protein